MMAEEFEQYDLNPYDISCQIILTYNEAGVRISNLVLQKMLYFVHKSYLQNYKTILCKEEFEAWKLGPVLRSVYYKYCQFGALELSVDSDIKIDIPDNVVETIKKEFEARRYQNPFELVRESHKQGGAWEQIYDHGKGEKQKIPNDLIYTCG